MTPTTVTRIISVDEIVVAEGIGDCAGCCEADGEGEADGVSDGEGDGVRLGEGEGEGLGEGVGVTYPMGVYCSLVARAIMCCPPPITYKTSFTTATVGPERSVGIKAATVHPFVAGS